MTPVDVTQKQHILLDFSNNEPPQSCGYDDSTGEDRFCCAEVQRRDGTYVTKPQPPLFPKVSLLHK